MFSVLMWNQCTKPCHTETLTFWFMHIRFPSTTSFPLAWMIWNEPHVPTQQKQKNCLSALLKNIIDSKQTKKKWRNKRKASSFTDVSDFQQLTRRPLMDGHYLLANTFMQLEVRVLFVSAWFEFMRDVWFFTVGHNLNRLGSVSPHHICLWSKCSIVSSSFMLVYKMYKSN